MNYKFYVDLKCASGQHWTYKFKDSAAQASFIEKIHAHKESRKFFTVDGYRWHNPDLLEDYTVFKQVDEEYTCD